MVDTIITLIDVASMCILSMFDLPFIAEFLQRRSIIPRESSVRVLIASERASYTGNYVIYGPNLGAI
jgi:hypothetical protein